VRSTDARSLEARSHHSPPGMSERAEDSKPGPRARAGGSASHKQVLRICSLLIALVGMGLTSRCLSAQVTLQLQSSRI